MLKLFKRRRPGVLTGREAVARALFSEHVQGSKLDLLDYEHSPRLQSQWLVEADLRIAHAASPDRFVAAHFGYTTEQWMSLPGLVKADKREEFFQVQGLAS
jgi:hypothetical protein